MAKRPRMQLSTKHIQLNKANQAVILATSLAVAVVVFGFFISRALIQRQQHQARVIAAKEQARDQLINNLEAKDQLVSAYQAFVTTERNLLGGSTDPAATGDRDGDNGRLVLDALPSKYDFPALATSIEKVLGDNGFQLETVEGTDDEANQTAVAAQPNPEPVEIPIGFTVNTSYSGAQTLMGLFERSIRPFRINSIEIAGAQDDDLSLKIDAVTYYQPEKSVSITKETIR